MLTELPNKQRYHDMPLTDLRNARNEAVIRFLDAIRVEMDRKTEKAVAKDKPSLEAEAKSMTDFLLHNATPAIMDLVFIQSQIEDIYETRLNEEVETALAYESVPVKIDALIRLFGLKISIDTEENPEGTMWLEISRKTIPSVIDTLNDISASDKALQFLRENHQALINELKIRERVESKRGPGRPRKSESSIDLGHYAALPTLRGFEHSLSAYPGGKSYIAQIDKTFYDSLDYNGDRLYLKGRPDITVTAQTLKREAISRVDSRVLGGLYSAFYKYYWAYRERGVELLQGNSFILPLPQLAQFMGVDLRQRKGAKGLFEKIIHFERFVGIMENGDMPRVLTYEDYDAESNAIVLNVPYFGRLVRAMQKSAQVLKSTETGTLTSYYNPTHGFLLHGNIFNEKNQAAYELVERLEALLLQAPQKGPKAAISFKQLVEETPQLSQALADAAGKDARAKTNRRNTLLKRAFVRAYELIEEKTDFYEAYINLKINGIVKGEKNKKPLIPTYKDLETKRLKLVITHSGSNPEYNPEKPIGEYP